MIICKPVLVVPFGLDMHLADQGAGGIDEDHLPRLCRSRNRLGYAMGRKDHRPVIGHFVQFLDKDRTLRLERYRPTNLLCTISWRT